MLVTHKLLFAYPFALAKKKASETFIEARMPEPKAPQSEVRLEPRQGLSGTAKAS